MTTRGVDNTQKPLMQTSQAVKEKSRRRQLEITYFKQSLLNAICMEVRPVPLPLLPCPLLRAPPPGPHGDVGHVGHDRHIPSIHALLSKPPGILHSGHVAVHDGARIERVSACFATNAPRGRAIMLYLNKTLRARVVALVTGTHV